MSSRFGNAAAATVIVAACVAPALRGQSPAVSTVLFDQARQAEADRHYAAATERLYQLVIEHPRSPEAWQARARLAWIRALTGDLSAALLQCQALRNELPDDHPLRQPVFELATILARRMRAPLRPPYFADSAAVGLRGLAQTDEPVRLESDATGNLLLVDAGAGRIVLERPVAPAPVGTGIEAAAFLPDGRLAVAGKAGISIAGAPASWWSATWGGKARQMKKVRSMAFTSTGDLIAVDKDYAGVLRCKAGGTACVPWGPAGKARAVVVGASDFVFILDDRQQSIRVADDAGRQITVVGPTTGGVAFREIVDIAVDRAFGLYVLDKENRRLDILTLRADAADALSVVPAGFVMIPSEGAVSVKNPSAVGVMPDGSVVIGGRSSARLLRFQ